MRAHIPFAKPWGNVQGRFPVKTARPFIAFVPLVIVRKHFECPLYLVNTFKIKSKKNIYNKRNCGGYDIFLC